jgi:hypothetical protein
VAGLLLGAISTDEVRELVQRFTRSQRNEAPDQQSGESVDDGIEAGSA